MHTTFMLLFALGLLLGCGGGRDRTADRDAAAMGDQPTTDTMASTSTASTDTAGDAGLAWGPAPPALPSGAKVAVVSGDPSKAGPFTIRIDMPPDYVIRPHHHPTVEEIRLLEGTLHLGHGPKWDEKAFKAVAPDQPVSIPAKQPHFVHAASRVLLEVQSTGPFEVTYVNPKDDPRTGSKP
jgi:mannose-6-phosphate isomerase-like protein (cupin superfamily)